MRNVVRFGLIVTLTGVSGVALGQGRLGQKPAGQPTVRVAPQVTTPAS